MRVETATPTQLVVMLYDGAIRFLSIAKESLASKDIESKHKNIVCAQNIFFELMATLNDKQGGDVAANLRRVYLYVVQLLVDANLKDDAAKLDQAIAIVREMRETWDQVHSITMAAQSSGVSDAA